MGFLNWLYISALLPTLQRERHSGLGQRLRLFEQRERLSLAENQALQFVALQALLKHAYETTDWYRTRMQEVGLTPESIRSADDLTRLSPLTRNDIRMHLADLCSAKFPSVQLHSSATGGTTDTPVTFRRDLDSLRTKTAAQIRFNTW